MSAIPNWELTCSHLQHPFWIVFLWTSSVDPISQWPTDLQIPTPKELLLLLRCIPKSSLLLRNTRSEFPRRPFEESSYFSARVENLWGSGHSHKGETKEPSRNEKILHCKFNSILRSKGWANFEQTSKFVHWGVSAGL